MGKWGALGKKYPGMNGLQKITKKSTRGQSLLIELAYPARPAWPDTP